MNEGVLVVVSGFSGAGKGALMKRLLEKYAEEYALSISATTRFPRPGERHGKEYFFLTKKEFEEMIQKDELIEYASYVGNYYGTPKKYVEERLTEGKSVILEIEIQGAMQIKRKNPDTMLIFVTPPSVNELRRRLINRGSESMEVINSRLSRAVEEAEYMEQYDYLLINDDLEECVEELHRVIQNEKKRRTDKKLANEIKKDIQQFKKGE